MQRLAHLSDIHLPPVPIPRLRDVSLKRLLGYANWHRNRKQRHLRATIDLLVADLRAHDPDHIALTGDLVNLGLPLEFIKAEQWVRELGQPDQVSLIPGNHDIYVRMLRDPGIWRLADYMSSSGTAGKLAAANLAAISSAQTRHAGQRARHTGQRARHSGMPARQTTFPFLRIIGDLALIGLNSGIPTAPFVASGLLGDEQRAETAKLLRELRHEGYCRVVLIHHPPLPGQAKAARGLRDAAAFREVLREAGAELVLHGHNHKQMLTFLETETGSLPVVGVPAASIAPPHHGDLARYNLFDIARDGDGWSIRMTGRGLAEDGSAFETCEIVQLMGAHEIAGAQP